MQSLHAGTIEQIRGGATDAAHKLLPLYRELLNDALGADDPERTAMFAAMLAVPSENYLGELMSEIDVDGLHRARGALRTVLGGELFDEWMAVYRRSTALGPYLPDSRSVGRRALRNLALGFLCTTGQSRVSDVRRVLLAQYRDADNLTDRLASLREIVNAEWLDDAARSGDDRGLLRALFDAETRHRSVVFGASGVPPSWRVGARRAAREPRRFRRPQSEPAARAVRGVRRAESGELPRARWLRLPFSRGARGAHRPF
jgi:aminopeptidase N